MGGGGGASLVVCERAMALPNTMARAATNKRKRNEFMMWLLKFSGVPRNFAYRDRNTGQRKKAVKNRSTRVKFCQRGVRMATFLVQGIGTLEPRSKDKSGESKA